MDTLLQDLRFAVRTLRTRPGFTTVAVLTLALGIGANTAIFSVVNAVLLRPLPYAQSDRLVEIQSSGMGGRARFGLSYPDYHDIVALGDVVSGIAAYTTDRYNLTGAGDPREATAARVTPNLFGLLGISPALGRDFSTADEREPVVILSHALWRSAFGSDSGVVGKTITLDGRGYTIVGVMAARFQFPDDGTDLWAPIGWAFADAPQLEVNRGYHAFSSVARLAAGAGIERLRADLDVLSRRIDAEQQAAADGGDQRVEVRNQGGPRVGPRVPAGPAGPTRMVESGFLVSALRDEVIGDVGRPLFTLLGAVALVLLIACANAANLLVARANARRKEIAIRRALGAGRSRLARQLLTESVLLATVAAVVGLVLARWGVDLLLATWPDALPRAQEIGMDARVLAFTLALAVLTGIGFGLLPALRASAPGLEESLRDDPGGTVGRRRRRTQAALVVGEVALALVMLVGAGLLVRSFIRLNQVDPGFDARDILAARVRLTPSRYANAVAQQGFFADLAAALRRQPGVTSVTVARTLPLSGNRMMLAMDPRTVRPDDPEQFLAMGLAVVGPDFFSTLRIPIRAGRAFTALDRAGAPLVAIVNTRLARRLWPDADPLGKTLPVGGPRGAPSPATVIGVIGDISSTALDETVVPEVYLPLAQAQGADQMWVVLRAAHPLRLAGVLRDAVRALDREQPVGDIVSFEQMIRRQEAARRFNTTLISLFAMLAVILAVIGIYGVTAYAVTQRTREFGIRIALGARAGDVLRLLVRENLVLVAIGIGMGLVVAAGVTRVLKTLLFGVGATDLASFAGAALLLAAVALVASYLPARRATRVDPVVALRTE